MGVSDFNCVICKDGGQDGGCGQCLDDWSKIDNDCDDVITKDYVLPEGSETTCSEIGYLFLFKENPLTNEEEENYQPPFELQIRQYSNYTDWDFESLDLLPDPENSWDRAFRFRLGYAGILNDGHNEDEIDTNKYCDSNELIWYSPKLKCWVVNMCANCYKYFISKESKQDPPNCVLLTEVPQITGEETDDFLNFDLYATERTEEGSIQREDLLIRKKKLIDSWRFNEVKTITDRSNIEFNVKTVTDHVEIN